MTIIEHWHHVTSDYGFLRCGIERLCREFDDWSNELKIKRKRKKIASLSAAFQALEPLTPFFTKTLFIQTKSDWIAVIQNGIHGSDPSSIVCYLARRMEVSGMRICSSPEGSMWPATIWEVYETKENGGVMSSGPRRTLYVSNDGGRWVFGESGAPYPFEKVERYKESMKRKRFDRDLLKEYVQKFGITLFDDEFFAVSEDHPAYLYEKSSLKELLGQKFRGFSLEEVKNGVPWKK